MNEENPQNDRLLIRNRFLIKIITSLVGNEILECDKENSVVIGLNAYKFVNNKEDIVGLILERLEKYLARVSLNKFSILFPRPTSTGRIFRESVNVDVLVRII